MPPQHRLKLADESQGLGSQGPPPTVGALFLTLLENFEQ